MQHLQKAIIPILVIAGLVCAFIFLPLQEWFEPLFEWTESMGWLGIVVYLALGILATLLLVPASIFVFSSGLIFGMWPGLLVAVGILAGSCSLGYLMGSTMWDKIKHLSFAQNQIFQAVRKALEEEGAYLIALLRVTPIFHFTLGNFFLGSLSVSYIRYVFASILGMLPGTALMVYGGHLSRASIGGSQDELSVWNWVMLGAGVVILFGIIWWVSHRTRQILKEA